MLFCLVHSLLVPLDLISVGFSSSPVSLTLGNQFVVKTIREKPPTTPGRAAVTMDWLPAPCQLPPAPAVYVSYEPPSELLRTATASLYHSQHP